jgi:3-methyladenine DNA glycosylase AlkD
MVKIFTYNENLDRQMKMIQIRLRQLMNGETAHQLKGFGLEYRKLYGVSLVHLRQLSQEFKPDNDLAERLWFSNIRESMILATMIAKRESITSTKLNEWTNGIRNIELAEQMSFNLLGKRPESVQIIEEWLLHPQVYVRYAALMAVGWQYRFVGNAMSALVSANLNTFEALATDSRLVRAVSHCLKMAGRFDEKLKPQVSGLARKWSETQERGLKEAGKEILYELEI